MLTNYANATLETELRKRKLRNVTPTPQYAEQNPTCPRTLQKARAQITMQIHTIKTLTHAASKTAAADQRETHGQETQTELH